MKILEILLESFLIRTLCSNGQIFFRDEETLSRFNGKVQELIIETNELFSFSKKKCGPNREDRN